MNEDKVYTFTIVEESRCWYKVYCKALNIYIHSVMPHTLPQLMKVLATDYCAVFEFEV